MRTARRGHRNRICCAVAAAVLVGIPSGVASAAGPERAPTVTGLAPSRGGANDVPLVAVSGTGFAPAASVTFGGAAATQVDVRSPTLLYARPPAHPALGTVHVRVTTASGMSSRTPADRYTTTAPPAVPTDVVALGLGVPRQVDCPAPTFCMVLGDARAVTVHATTPGSLLDVPLDGPSLGLSCPTASFCAAVSADAATTFDGSSWAPTTHLDDELSPFDRSPLLSCSGPAFCAALGNDGAWWRYDGTTWNSFTRGPRIGSGATDWGVSCTSPTFCMADLERLEPVSTDPDEYVLHGRIVRFDGTAWTTVVAYSLDTDTTNANISCVSTRYCVTTGYTYNGTRWTRGGAGLSGGFGVYYECFAVDACMGTDSFEFNTAYPMHHLYRWDGTAWSNRGVVPASAPTVVSCADTTDCVSVSRLGYLRRWTEATGWGGAHPLGNWLYHANTVSCVRGPRCVMANAHGQVAAWDGQTWTPPVQVDPAAHPTSVSCATATWCVLVDDAGRALTYDGTTWSAPASIDSRRLNEVSCPTVGFCVAVDEDGYVVRLEAAAWHTPTQRNPSGPLRGVSCVSATFCMAVGDGNSIQYVGHGTWTGRTDLGRYAGSVSCSATTFCLIGTGTGGHRFWGEQAFSPSEVNPQRNAPTSLSCTPSQYCASVTHTGESAIVTLFDGAAHTGPLTPVLDGVGYGDWREVSCWARGKCVFLGAGEAAAQIS